MLLFIIIWALLEMAVQSIVSVIKRNFDFVVDLIAPVVPVLLIAKDAIKALLTETGSNYGMLKMTKTQ